MGASSKKRAYTQAVDPKCFRCFYHGNCLYENTEACGMKASYCCDCECVPCKDYEKRKNNE
jgi:hypothetical protein